MARENNFLLGYGERLTSTVNIKIRGGPKNPPYDFSVAKAQVSAWAKDASTHFASLPKEACPNEQVTAVITMHPRYISKSDFPRELLDEARLKAVGGRLKRVQPRQWGVKIHPEEALTDELIVMGTRNDISSWANQIKNWNIEHRGANHIMHLEDFSALKGYDRIKHIPENKDEFLLEVVLHNCYGETVDFFEKYANSCDSKIVKDRIRYAEGLTFIPVYTTKQSMARLSEFSFIRVMRGMPSLRTLNPVAIRKDIFFPIELPKELGIDTNIRVAIFDGGIPDKVVLPWVRKIEPSGIGKPVDDYLIHGLAVTSAFLFGPLEKSSEISRPFCHIDHIRVLDEKTGSNGDFECYDVLDRITNVLDNAEEPYDFINLSLGPDMSIDDDEVTRWTASMDEKLKGGRSLATVAAGNSGQLDAISGLNRIQPPSDAINCLCVGSCNNVNLISWERVDYSCIGPGRCPGIVKPDGVAFGGSSTNPFMVLSPSTNPIAMGIQGTSFASPYALRSAVSVRTQLGNVLSPMAIRALLIHRADRGSNHQFDVGWGRFETDYAKLITCDDDEVLVTFQGELPIKEHLRVPIPMPEGDLNGDISVIATLVISPEVDPAFPNVYTRGGLEVTFRPDSTKFKPDKEGKIPENPSTKSFFSDKSVCGEAEYNLREEGYKWEPCLKATKNFRSSTLKEPCFDIYYHSRQEGTGIRNPEAMPYAFIVSVKAHKMRDFYEKVARAYTNILIPLQPSVRIQIRR